MNKTYLIAFSLLFFCVKLKAQTFEKIFLGPDFQQYKGALFKIDDGDKSLYGVLLPRLVQAKNKYDNDVVFPLSNDKHVTNRDSLKNKVFRVDKILDSSGEDFNDKSHEDQAIFVLVDTISKQNIFFRYSRFLKSEFPFVSSPIKLNEEKECSKIARIKDDFTGDVNIYSPSSSGDDISPLTISKTIKKGKTNYQLNLYVGGSSERKGLAGVIFLFADGSKLTKPMKIGVAGGIYTGFEYSAIMPMGPTDFAIFETKRLKKFRIYMYDKEVGLIDGERFKIYVKCINKAI